MRYLEGRTIALCVTGSIAAYKSGEIARRCIKAGARVVPVMTRSATHFIGPVTMSGLCGRSPAIDMWDASFAGEMHVDISREVDAVLIAPATADVLARLAHGRADDLVTALALCARGPVLAAPAMHPRMWEHPATQRNVAELIDQGRVTLLGPVRGAVASGEHGQGRMVEPKQIVEALERVFAPKDLNGVRIVITAGPTIEDIDPVRFLGNRSTGKMGFAVAKRATARGADVTLIAGPVALETPPGVRRVDVRGAMSMRTALWAAAGPDLAGIDALVMTAAVADHRPANTSPTKLKKDSEHVSLQLVKNPDLLAEIGAAREGRLPVLVGFAVETGDTEALVNYARSKLATKRVDYVVANEARQAFGGDENIALIVSSSATEELGRLPKGALADAILDRIKEQLSTEPTRR